MNWNTFEKLFADMHNEGYITKHKIYSDDGHNELLEIHYKINYGKKTHEPTNK